MGRKGSLPRRRRARSTALGSRPSPCRSTRCSMGLESPEAPPARAAPEGPAGRGGRADRSGGRRPIRAQPAESSPPPASRRSPSRHPTPRRETRRQRAPAGRHRRGGERPGRGAYWQSLRGTVHPAAAAVKQQLSARLKKTPRSRGRPEARPSGLRLSCGLPACLFSGHKDAFRRRGRAVRRRRERRIHGRLSRKVPMGRGARFRGSTLG